MEIGNDGSCNLYFNHENGATNKNAYLWNLMLHHSNFAKVFGSKDTMNEVDLQDCIPKDDKTQNFILKCFEGFHVSYHQKITTKLDDYKDLYRTLYTSIFSFKNVHSGIEKTKKKSLNKDSMIATDVTPNRLNMEKKFNNYSKTSDPLSSMNLLSEWKTSMSRKVDSLNTNNETESEIIITKTDRLYSPTINLAEKKNKHNHVDNIQEANVRIDEFLAKSGFTGFPERKDFLSEEGGVMRNIGGHVNFQTYPNHHIEEFSEDLDDSGYFERERRRFIFTLGNDNNDKETKLSNTNDGTDIDDMIDENKKEVLRSLCQRKKLITKIDAGNFFL